MVNAEHYPDPTAELAIARADRELRIKRMREQRKNRKRYKYGRGRSTEVLQVTLVADKKGRGSEA